MSISDFAPKALTSWAEHGSSGVQNRHALESCLCPDSKVRHSHRIAFWDRAVRDVDWTAARELRRKAQLNVSARRSDDTSFSVIVTDISRDGCQLRTEATFDVGELIELKHELLGTLSAEVRWACAGRVGLQFMRPI